MTESMSAPPITNPRWYAEDLDRCEHGRHVKDPCFGCPGGWSAGNLCLLSGVVIGHTLYGEPIRVLPEWRRDVEKWCGHGELKDCPDLATCDRHSREWTGAS